MPSLMTFEEALDKANDCALNKTILLGNGFSMDFDPKIFGYESLAKEAKLPGLSTSKADLFGTLNSTNFEVVIDKLRASADLVSLYGGKKSLAAQLRDDADVVQNGLADVLADRHPEHAYVLTDDHVLHARAFLSNFDEVFTLSYDLLLYWVVNRTMVGYAVPQADGFEWPTFNNRSFLVWKTNPSTAQEIHYLHGALHLYRQDNRIRKLQYDSHGRLVEEMRDRLAAGRHPLVVTEGKMEEKVARIESSRYLRTALRRYGKVRDALFVHGFSFSENDEHVIEPLESEDSAVEALFVGTHGSLGSRSGRRIKDRVHDIRDERKRGRGSALDVYFYDTKSAHVWR